MTQTIDIVNRAMQSLGTRTTIASLSEQSNEAIQANIALTPTLNELLRMAPWNCGRNYASLQLITAAPGTPENPTTGPSMWQKGFPPPPWAYEYQYPSDCLKALFVVPQFSTGFASGIPITTAVTGGSTAYWMGPPQRFQVSVDQLFYYTTVNLAAGGTGYVIGEIVSGPTHNSSGQLIGAPVQLMVTGTMGPGMITSFTMLSSVLGETVGGSYTQPPPSSFGQSATTGVGVNATFSGASVTAPADQRVTLTNQEFAILTYVKTVTDPNVMDPAFVEAWVALLAGRLVYALMGDKPLANIKLQEANVMISEARKSDGNEALTVNDITPDWIRARGIYYPTWEITPNIQFDWGPLLTMY